MQHKVTPMKAEIFEKDGHFDSKNCANFEIINKGETTVLIDSIYELEPGDAEFFPSVGTCVAYEGEVKFNFKSERDKANKIIIKATRYVRIN